MGSTTWTCCSCCLELLLYFLFILFITYNVNWLQENRIFDSDGEEFVLGDYHEPIEASKSIPDLVTITGTSIYYNNKAIPGSVVIFKKGKRERGFCVEIDRLDHWEKVGIRFYTIPVGDRVENMQKQQWFKKGEHVNDIGAVKKDPRNLFPLYFFSFWDEFEYNKLVDNTKYKALDRAGQYVIIDAT